MPIGWNISDTHEDLFRISHQFLCSPWETGILDGWTPSRTKGWRPGLAFSGGVIHCLYALMPPETLLFYHQRDGFESNLNHTNAFRFIEKLRKDGKQVVTVKSNHEQIEFNMVNPQDLAQICWSSTCDSLADFFELGAVAMGMPLENAYLFHGHKGRDFNDSSYWKTHSTILQKAGLDLIFPTAGASEIINQTIVEQSPYDDYSESCLRSSEEGKCVEGVGNASGKIHSKEKRFRYRVKSKFFCRNDL